MHGGNLARWGLASLIVSLLSLNIARADTGVIADSQFLDAN